MPINVQIYERERFVYIHTASNFILSLAFSVSGLEGNYIQQRVKRFGLLDFDPQQSVHLIVAGKVFLKSKAFLVSSLLSALQWLRIPVRTKSKVPCTT